MRKITKKIYSIIFFLIVAISNAQISTGTGAVSILSNTPNTNTNLGIGINNPIAKLDINGFPAINTTYVFSSESDSFMKSILLNIGSLRENSTSNNGTRLLTFYDVPPSNISANAQTIFAIEDRNDANRFKHNAIANGSSTLKISDKTQSAVFDLHEDGTSTFLFLPKPNSYLTIGGRQVWPVPYKLMVKNGDSRFEGNLYVDTNIGIGTSNFTDGADTYRLSVKGKVRAEEVKVYNTWADYVFSPSYTLSSLKEVEDYIAKNGHLQNVPSASDITKNGLELGEMAKIQQEKIEELTLYLIQQNKEIEELKSQVKLLLSIKK
ncbi:hypothetical protein [Flavobacterium aquidurense]|uniref:Uncharacterized protein n=1 Tax=Flavobacterium aquidurense TaxID=362413 RepID=A0A0Q0RYZ1_9FLAO|nr:hypothetical protein [Flavobacterium aquidurense]KQB37715.1 hypothetical protein RC62_2881 [Flavobacterium aquidurense]